MLFSVPMTTVTEAAKRLGVDLHPLDQADLEMLRSDPVLAQQFARRLALAAKEIAPAANWSVEDLRDVLEVAVQGTALEGVRVVEGRYLRKRVREQCAFTERYGEPFALVVVQLRPEPHEGLYAKVVESVVEKLRRTDMIAIYKRRFALLLPRMEAATLPSLLDRIAARVDQVAGKKVVEGVDGQIYPDAAYPDTQSVLDWLEDHLRLD
jgi:hypothetical protein